MSYYFYLDKMLLPIAPDEMELKINNQNKTLSVINDGEVNILKKAGLSEISFEARIPQVRYPFARYSNGFVKAKVFLDRIEELKVDQEPFQFIVSRRLPNGQVLFNTNMKVSLEEYSIDENASDGFDLVVPIKLKQYRDFGTKTVKIDTSSQNNTKPKVSVKKPRPATTSPAPKKKPKSHTVVRGDTLWAISKRYYGQSNWPLVNKIVAANRSKIRDPHWIYPGQVFIIPV